MKSYIYNALVFCCFAVLSLSSCSDHSYIKVGTVYNYPEWQAQKFDFEGCRIIHNKKEYKHITDTPLPDGWDIDFDNNVLALVRGVSHYGIHEIEVEEALTSDTGYHIKVLVEQTFVNPVIPWAVAIVMKKASKEEIHFDVKYSSEDNEPHGY